MGDIVNPSGGRTVPEAVVPSAFTAREARWWLQRQGRSTPRALIGVLHALEYRLRGFMFILHEADREHLFLNGVPVEISSPQDLTITIVIVDTRGGGPPGVHLDIYSKKDQSHLELRWDGQKDKEAWTYELPLGRRKLKNKSFAALCQKMAKWPRRFSSREALCLFETMLDAVRS